MPDIEANVTGTPSQGGVYTFNDRDYDASEIGTVVGRATVSDGTQAYAGWGWRTTNRTGFNFFSEFGVVATNVDVSLRTTNNLEPVSRASYVSTRSVMR